MSSSGFESKTVYESYPFIFLQMPPLTEPFPGYKVNHWQLLDHQQEVLTQQNAQPVFIHHEPTWDMRVEAWILEKWHKIYPKVYKLIKIVVLPALTLASVVYAGQKFLINK